MNTNGFLLLLILITMLAIAIYNFWFSYQLAFKNRTELLLSKKERKEQVLDLSSARKPVALTSLLVGIVAIIGLIYILLISVNAPFGGVIRVSALFFCFIAGVRNGVIRIYMINAQLIHSGKKQ